MVKCTCIFIMVFVLGVSTVSICKQCSVKEATHICMNFLKEIFKESFKELFQTKKQLPQTVYPVVVGWDGFRIVPQLVTTEFKKVCANFEVCYLSGYKLEDDNNTVKYQFAVERKPDSSSDEDLQELIQKQSEEILTELLLTYGCNLPAETLTAVELQKHFLYVIFARTPEGIKQLDAFKQRIVQCQASRKRQKRAGELSEEWKDERDS